MEKERSYEGGFSVIEITAVVAVLFLVGSAVWQSRDKIDTQKTNLSYEARTISKAEDNGPDSYTQALAEVTASGNVGSAITQQLMNSYVAAKNQGIYTPQYAAALGTTLAPMIETDLAYDKFTDKNIQVDQDTSEKASLAYQNALHDALAPLRTNTTPEFELFAMYVKTKNPKYLTDLVHIASLYESAALNAALLVVPTDVLQYHLAILNSLEEFGAVLNALSVRANDPIESTVLLRNYNNAEQDVLSAFNALRSYYAKKYAHSN